MYARRTASWLKRQWLSACSHAPRAAPHFRSFRSFRHEAMVLPVPVPWSMATPCAAHRVRYALAAASASTSAAPFRRSLCRPCLSGSGIAAPRRPSSWARCSSTDLHQRTTSDGHAGYSDEAPQGTTSIQKKAKRASRSTSPPASASTAAAAGPRRTSKAYADLPTHASEIGGEPLVSLEPFVPTTSQKSARPRKPRATKAPDEVPPGTEAVEAPADGSTALSQNRGHGGQPGQDAVAVPRLDELGPQGQAWPPLAKDVLTNLARFPGCLLLTRVGGFYEVSGP